MKLILCFVLLFADSLTSQTFKWTRDFKASHDTRGTQVLSDSLGDCYVVSEYHYDYPHEPSIDGCVLRKYDKSGALLWSTETQDEYYWKILFDPIGQLVLFAKYSGTVYRAVVNPQDGMITQKQPVAPGAWFNSVEFDKSGNLFVTGLYRDSLVLCNTTSTGTCCDNSLFSAKFDASGNCMWLVSSKGTPYFGWSAIDTFGNTFITGIFYKSMSLGQHTITGNLDYSGFIAKIDAFGNVSWLKRVSDPYSPYCTQIATDQWGFVYVGGQFDKPFTYAGYTISPTGNSDAFILKFYPSGNPVWVKKLGSTQAVSLQNIFAHKEDLFVTGAFKSDFSVDNTCSLLSANTLTYNYPGTDEPFLACFDIDGSCRWAMDAGCDSNGVGYGASVHKNNGNLYMAGTFNGNIFFGEPSPHHGGLKMFISKITEPLPVNLKETVLPDAPVAVFPNPATGVITLQGMPAAETYVQIINSVGQSVKLIKGYTADSPICIEEFSPGIYIINASQGTKSYRIKFIKSP